MNHKLLSLLACLTLAAFVLSCGSQNQYLSKGKELIKSNKRRKEERAAVEFKKAVEQEPDNAEAHYLLGYYDEKSTVEERGKQMYLAYTYDRKKYLDILVYETLRDREQVVKEVRNSALNALKKIYKSGDRGKKDVLKYLMKAIKSKDNRDRYDAGWALAELGKDDPGTIVPKLIDLLDHKRMETRLNAVVALGEIGDKSAAPRLVELINSGSAEKKRDRETAEVRRLAVEALRKIGGVNSVDELVRILENRGSSMRVDAIEALSAIGDEKAVPSLLKVLGEKGSRKVKVTFK
ncbi:MAG: HEAT repeat domain-containing protein [Candidatus Poribacteria bacterium]